MSRPRLVVLLAVLLVLAAASSASAASLYSGPGPRPGPDALYAPPADAPQLRNEGVWRAPPILVSGASAYRDGEFLYQDWIFDDHGARGLRDPSDPRFDNDTFSAPYGTYTYPTDARYAQNAADLVELRVKPVAGATAIRLTYNTLIAPELTATTIAIGSSAVALPLPHGANARSPAQLFLTVHGSSADLRVAATGTPVTPAPAVSVSRERRQIEVRVPHAAWNPGTSKVRFAAGTGLWDPAAGRYLVPSAAASGSRPGGAQNPAATAIFNAAFRYETRNPDGAPAAGEEPQPQIENGVQAVAATRWWRDQAQGDALANGGDLSPFFATVDFGRLAAGADDDLPGQPKGVPQRGPINRILASRHEPGQGQDFRRSCGDATNCEGELLSRLQPYAIYIPRKAPPPKGYGMTLLLHSLGANYNQFTGSNNQSQFGERATGSIVITPAGRGPDGWYYGLAGADTFEVWADVARRYALDPDFTSIAGYSMGGYGTFKFATQYPDLFARAQPTVGPPSLGVSLTGSDSTGGAASNTGPMLPSVRHVPFMMWVAAADELVPITGTTAQAQRFDDLGYRYIFDVFAPAEHLTLATKDQFAPGAQFLGDARVLRDPAHVTYVVNPKMDFPEVGTVADHAYWLSGLRVRNGGDDAPRGTIDVVSEGFGRGDPSVGATQSGGGSLTGGGPVPPALAYTRRSKAWTSGAPVGARRDRLRITAANVSRVVVNPQRARVTCGAELEVESDGPITVELSGCSRTERFGRPESGGGARGCVASIGFLRTAVRPRGPRLRLEAAPVGTGRFKAEVFRQSRGRRIFRDLLVARFTRRTGSFTWNGRSRVRGRKVGDGIYMVRFTRRLAGGRRDVRRKVLERRAGRWIRRGDHYRRSSCGRLRMFKLRRPVFGGRRGDPLGVALRVSRRSRVAVQVLRRGRVVRRFKTRTLRSGRTHRLRMSARGKRRGTYTVSVRVGRGKRAVVARLYARRL